MAIAPTTENTQSDKDMDVNKVDEVREALPELERWATKMFDVAESFNDACKAVSEKANIDASVLKQYVKARVKDREGAFEKKMSDSQLLLGLFIDEG